MKIVWVVFDPLLECIISVHETEKGADDRCILENDKNDRWKTYYLIENQGFDLEG